MKEQKSLLARSPLLLMITFHCLSLVVLFGSTNNLYEFLFASLMCIISIVCITQRLKRNLTRITGETGRERGVTGSWTTLSDLKLFLIY